jgi:hypothetical protein
LKNANLKINLNKTQLVRKQKMQRPDFLIGTLQINGLYFVLLKIKT